MDVLHLTDLHVTAPNTSLEGVWSTAFDQLRAANREKFDFIVVSGDLTQQADPDEYKQLLRFTKNELLPRLKKRREKHRVVFVPGNHDVNWGHAKALRPIPRGTTLSEDLIIELQTRPHTSRLRAKITKKGTLDLRERDPEHYPGRFNNVQKFLDDFYGKRVDGRYRQFALTNHQARDHWSAHVFKKERIAFYGFNSCFHNDGYWRGATLEEDAVTAAVSHARKYAHGFLWIAIWHHGLASDRGNPDHLIARDLGLLRAAGFRVGIHGHTHADEFGDVRDILGERFPIVATGSFAAGASERPEGTLNQFSVLELSASYLVIDRYERQPTMNWRRRRLPPYVLRDVDTATDVPFNDAERHRREFTLDVENGFTQVEIEFMDIDAHREIVLAEPYGPYSNIVSFKTHADGIMADAVDVTGPDGRNRIRFAGSSGHYKSLKWSCQLSNVLARDRADLIMRSPPSGLGQRLRGSGWSGYDWIVHTVRVHSRELTLSIVTNSSQSLFAQEEVGIRVFDENEQEKTTEASRLKPIVNDAGTVLRARIERPSLGYRYVLGYRPSPHGRRVPPPILTLLSNLSEILRSGHSGDARRERLTEGIETGLRIALGRGADERLVWYGYLWNHRRQRLETAFGRCPWSAAGSEFAYGKGIVGHAFRMRRAASYFATKGATSLILEGATDFDWIVAVPILLDEEGPAVGVIAFAGRDTRGWDLDLRDYARGAADEQRFAQHVPSEEQNEREARVAELEGRLLQASTLFFWHELHHMRDDLGSSDRAAFDLVFDRWRELIQNRGAETG